MERELNSNLSGNEFYFKACSLLVMLKNSCSKLHCQKGFDLVPFSYKIVLQGENRERERERDRQTCRQSERKQRRWGGVGVGWGWGGAVGVLIHLVGPLHVGSSCRSAAERRGNTLKHLNEFCLEPRPWLSSTPRVYPCEHNKCHL
jgi:hypothetical protein